MLKCLAQTLYLFLAIFDHCRGHCNFVRIFLFRISLNVMFFHTDAKRTRNLTNYFSRLPELDCLSIIFFGAQQTCQSMFNVQCSPIRVMPLWPWVHYLIKHHDEWASWWEGPPWMNAGRPPVQVNECSPYVMTVTVVMHGSNSFLAEFDGTAYLPFHT